MKNQHTRISKSMSLLLRHKPEAGQIELDAHGWVTIGDLISGLAHLGYTATQSDIEAIVLENDKQRFVIDGDRIRANQGHSVSIDLQLSAQTPPTYLLHGTVQKYIASIFKHGLRKQQRHHVHLSADQATAEKVGSRRGTAIILRIDSARMHADGFCFYQSDNGVWLTDHVPPQYINVYS